MGHIFKHPHNNSKGIIVFTHKEISFFETYPINFINKVYSKINGRKKFIPFYEKRIKELQKKYYIGIHFGWHHPDYPKKDYVDFYMGGPGTVSFSFDDPFFIPLNSSSFTPAVFKDMGIQNKYWDIICVSNPAKHKNLDVLLREIKKIYQQGYNYKILLLNTSKTNEDHPSYYTNLTQDYYQLFTPQEREHFTLLKLHEKLGFLGLSQTQLAFLYNNSKVFTLFTQKEGESRVISEALLCGLPVVVKHDLEGGGRDFLNETNSVFFQTYDTAHKGLIEAVENIDRFDLENNEGQKEASEFESLQQLKSYFSKLYQNNNDQFNGELINSDFLNFRLPGHFNDVPWNINRYITSDILTRDQFNTFYNTLQL